MSDIMRNVVGSCVGVLRWGLAGGLALGSCVGVLRWGLAVGPADGSRSMVFILDY